MSLIICYCFALLIGLSLSLLGTGGAILAIPALVYIAKLPLSEVVVISLLTVMLVSLSGLISNIRAKIFTLSHFKFAIVVLPLTTIGAYIGSEIGSGELAEQINRLIVFSVLAIASGLSMLYSPTQSSSLPISKVWKFILLAICLPFIGIISGFIGIGGGFLLVPLIYYITPYNVKESIAISLMLISLGSSTAFINYITEQTMPSNTWFICAVFSGLALVGSLIGSYISHKISLQSLKKAFGGFVVFLGVLNIVLEIL